MALTEAARRISAFGKTHSCKLIPSSTRKTGWLPFYQFKPKKFTGKKITNGMIFGSQTWGINFCPFQLKKGRPKDGNLLGLEWDMIPRVSNLICPDQNFGITCPYSKGSDTIWCLTWRKRHWKVFEYFVRPLVVPGKYLEIFHPGAFWKAHLCKLVPNWTWKIVWLPILIIKWTITNSWFHDTPPKHLRLIHLWKKN